MQTTLIRQFSPNVNSVSVSVSMKAAAWCTLVWLVLILGSDARGQVAGSQVDEAQVAGGQVAEAQGPRSMLAKVTLNDESVVVGEIVAVTDSGLELIENGAKQTISLELVSSVSLPQSDAENATAEAAQASRGTVIFVDGSQVNFADAMIGGTDVGIVTVAGTKIEAGVAQLKSISFLNADAGDQEKNQWAELLAQPQPASDAIVVSRNGVLQMIEGVVGDVDQQQLTFTMESRTANVALEKIKGVIFYRAKRELADPICQLTLSDRSTFLVRKIEPTDAGFQVTLVGGSKLLAGSSQVLEMDFSAGRSVWLSDLVPSTNTWTPLLASPQILPSLEAMRLARFNESFRGQPLTLKSIPQEGLGYLAQTQEFKKGVAVSGGGRVVFALNQQFKRLTGVVGFDPKAYPGATVRFVVKTDGQTAISEELRSDELLQPVKVDLDVSTTRRISIAVEYADGKEAGDVLHLANFKVLR